MIELRLAQPRDVEALIALQSVLHTSQAQWVDGPDLGEPAAKVYRRLADPSCAVFVAVRDERVVGFIAGGLISEPASGLVAQLGARLRARALRRLPTGIRRRLSDRLAPGRTGAVAVIQDVAVAHAARREGVADALLERFATHWRGRGAARLGAGVMWANVASRGLFTKHGFRPRHVWFETDG